MFVIEILTQGILIDLVEYLLKNKTPNSAIIDEEYLETAVKLLRVTNPVLVRTGASNNERVQKFYLIIGKIAQGLAVDQNGKSLYSLRIKFMCEDLINKL